MPPSFFFYFHNLIRCAVQNPAQPTERDHGNISSLFQGVQRSVVNAALEQLILRHALFSHCYPQRPIVEHEITTITKLLQLYCDFRKIHIVIIITICYNGFTITKEAVTVEKEYFIDTLFDLINESDALEADLQDVSTDRENITITMKDGTVFILTLSG